MGVVLGKIGVIDAGIGNWTSVVNALESIGVPAFAAREPTRLNIYSHLILPGIGSFHNASKKLSMVGWRFGIQDFVTTGKPILGICLGMHLLGIESEEGEGQGLSLLKMSTKKLSADGSLRVPNIGWGELNRVVDHPILRNIEPGSRFYFSHSYGVERGLPVEISTTVHNKAFSSIVAKDNVVGVQFHPEKSHSFGKEILKNFTRM